MDSYGILTRAPAYVTCKTVRVGGASTTSPAPVYPTSVNRGIVIETAKPVGNVRSDVKTPEIAKSADTCVVRPREGNACKCIV